MKKDNARHSEQLNRMNALYKSGICFFCKKNYLSVGASPEIYRNTSWYIKKNDYPYTGSTHHYLIVSNKHLNKITQLSLSQWSKLRETIKWLQKKLASKGESIFIRSGDLRYTGATFGHLHFHYVAGGPKKKGFKLRDNIRATLGYRKK